MGLLICWRVTGEVSMRRNGLHVIESRLARLLQAGAIKWSALISPGSLSFAAASVTGLPKDNCFTAG